MPRLFLFAPLSLVAVPTKQQAKKAKAEEAETGVKLVADNRRAFFNYAVDEKLEAGVALTGSEIKSVREGRVDLRDGYAKIDGGQAYLRNVRIARWPQASA
ncbi:MAG: SsrA-binding protein, partial [Chloroflexota bacterium]|nr:SsrA-binding protein [Chloroflexota bacterium]